MRRRMAAKIAPMNMPPQRIALVAIVVLLLAGGAAWWWQARKLAPGVQAARTEARAVAAKPASRMHGASSVASGESKSDPVVMAAMEQCGEALMAGMRERARQLSVRDDSASQLASALTPYLEDGTPPSRDEDLERLLAERQVKQQRAFKRARELDPTHPDITWLAAEKCVEGPGCEAVQQAALQAEPDNAAVWLRAMTWARMRKDDAAMENAFKRAVAAPHYDTHRGSTLLAVMEGYAGLATPPICMAPGVQALASQELPGGRSLDAMTFVEIMAMAGEAANVMYGMELRTLCKSGEGDVLPRGRQADCVRLYSTMASDPSAVEQWRALSQLVELTADAPEGPAHRERFRQLQWLMQEQRKDWKQFGMDSDGVEAMQETLAKVGRWPPPAEWLPKDERARSLILTGRPPPEKKPK
ncbi:hypothetical protein GCM10010080_18330 [Thermomonas carbonis]|nr:hypothetical protein GCM10010080_18330 [Thermomonas carbonis]